MLRMIRFQIVFASAILALAACAPTAIVSSEGTQPTPVIEQVAAPRPSTYPHCNVNDVQLQFGFGSPLPVDAFISAELPDTLRPAGGSEDDAKRFCVRDHGQRDARCA